MRKGICAFLMVITLFIPMTVLAQDNHYYYDAVLQSNLEKRKEPKDPLGYLEMEDMEYKTLSDHIVANIDDDYEKVHAIHNWVCENIYYDYESYSGGLVVYNDEDFQKLVAMSSYDMLMTYKRGVCSYYSAVFSKLVRAQNIPCVTVSGYAINTMPDSGNGFYIVNQTDQTVYALGDLWTEANYNTSEINHSWNEVYVNDEWIIVDTTWDSTNRYVNGNYINGTIMQTYFDIPDELFAINHKIIQYERQAYISQEEKDEESIQELPDSWARPAVEQAIRKNIVPLDLQKNYTEAITREQFAELAIQFLTVKAPEILSTGQKITFTDTDNESVQTAASIGIISGVGDGRFNPSGSLTRQEAAVILKQICDKLGKTFLDVGIDFEDEDAISEWAKESVEKVSVAGLMDGYENRFDPLGTFTVQQAISVFNRLYEIHL